VWYAIAVYNHGTEYPYGLLSILIMLVFFTLPANLFLYGINDLNDTDTDRENPKKAWYESLFDPKDKSGTIRSIALTTLPFVWIVAWLMVSVSVSYRVIWSLALFFFLWWAYSALPLRLKSRPVLDSVSNVLYIMPWLFAYTLSWWDWVGLWFLAAVFWAMAMHTFSAVPDREVDEKAGITTTAVLLWKRDTLLYCTILWVGAAYFSHSILWWWSYLFGALYAGFAVYALLSSSQTVWRLYTFFPWINTLVGFIIFWFFFHSYFFALVTSFIQRAWF
jgi:4-hydroxybenzoate polyprenyltransferase